MTTPLLDRIMGLHAENLAASAVVGGFINRVAVAKPGGETFIVVLQNALAARGLGVVVLDKAS